MINLLSKILHVERKMGDIRVIFGAMKNILATVLISETVTSADLIATVTSLAPGLVRFCEAFNLQNYQHFNDLYFLMHR